MATLGQTLKETREAKGLTTSESAAATRIKVQHIEAIEKDDFTKIPAPAYAKGFIKLYAEFLGLDPAPFVAAYMQYYAPKNKDRVSIYPSDADREDSEEPGGGKKKLKWLNAYKIPGKLTSSLAEIRRKILLVGGGGVILLVVIIVGFKQCTKDGDLLSVNDQPSVKTENRPVKALIEEPADTYLDPDGL